MASSVPRRSSGLPPCAPAWYFHPTWTSGFPSTHPGWHYRAPWASAPSSSPALVSCGQEEGMSGPSVQQAQGPSPHLPSPGKD